MTSEPSKNDKGSVTLRVLGQIPPSFKNRKRIFKKKNGQQFLGTRADVKKRMTDLTESFVFALLSAYRTDTRATSTGCSLPSWIASSLPEDDSWKCVPEIIVTAEPTKEASIEIEITEL